MCTVTIKTNDLLGAVVVMDLRKIFHFVYYALCDEPVAPKDEGVLLCERNMDAENKSVSNNHISFCKLMSIPSNINAVVGNVP